MDRIIREARAHRMRVLLMLFGAPRWANGGRSPEYAPRRPADFADFARAAARRYPAVRRWMIWGEPSRWHNFRPLTRQPLGTPITSRQARAPKRYARLLDGAYGQLKAERRSNLADLLRRAWELRDVCTIYDALYVGLTEALDATLITRDARLARGAGAIIDVVTPD